MQTLYAIRVKGTESFFVSSITIDSTGVSVDKDFLECSIIIERNKAYNYVKLLDVNEYEVARLDITITRDTTQDVTSSESSKEKANEK